MINFLKSHWIAFIIIFNIILIAIAAAIIINHQSKTATIDILVAPSDSTILINGKPFQDGEHNIHPGDYTLKIEKDGFETKTVNFTIGKGEFKRLYYYLLSNNSFSYYDAETNANDVFILETIAKTNDDEELNTYLRKREDKLSILSVLPLIYAEFKGDKYIEYAVRLNSDAISCPKILCLKIIDINGDNEQNSLNLIKEKGYNPEDYEIEYVYKPIKALE